MQLSCPVRPGCALAESACGNCYHQPEISWPWPHTRSCQLPLCALPPVQHVPLRIMRMRIKNGMQPPTNFATVVTDLTTCHNTWFHPGVDRCAACSSWLLVVLLGCCCCMFHPGVDRCASGTAAAAAAAHGSDAVGLPGRLLDTAALPLP